MGKPSNYWQHTVTGATASGWTAGCAVPHTHMINLEQVEKRGAAKRIWNGAVQCVVVQVQLRARQGSRLISLGGLHLCGSVAADS